jgi:NADH:ubiquinone oxidoreductase subunit E
MNNIEAILKNFPDNDRENLLPILQEVQKAEGYISEQSVVMVGEYLKIPTSKVYAVSTFYDQFRFIPGARYKICLCNGTACHMEGSGGLLKAFEKILNITAGQMTRDNMFSLRIQPCMGACGMAPVVRINDIFYTNANVEMVAELIASIKENEGL